MYLFIYSKLEKRIEVRVCGYEYAGLVINGYKTLWRIDSPHTLVA
jgi:hypothetical protein